MTVLAFGGPIHYFLRAAFNFPSFAETYRHAAQDGPRRLERQPDHELRLATG